MATFKDLRSQITSPKVQANLKPIAQKATQYAVAGTVSAKAPSLLSNVVSKLKAAGKATWRLTAIWAWAYLLDQPSDTKTDKLKKESMSYGQGTNYMWFTTPVKIPAVNNNLGIGAVVWAIGWAKAWWVKQTTTPISNNTIAKWWGTPAISNIPTTPSSVSVVAAPTVAPTVDELLNTTRKLTGFVDSVAKANKQSGSYQTTSAPKRLELEERWFWIE